MWTGLLVLPDGSELYSGDPTRDAVMAITHTSRVQGEAEDLVPGGVASDELQIKVWLKAGGTLRITAGEELVYYRLDTAGKRTLVGHFLTDKPTRASRNAYKITARDRMSLADVDLSPWLRSIQGEFPMPLETFARRVAEKCGLTLAGPLPRNGDYLVRAFYADDLTGRQLLSWVAEATATFCHCTPAGEIAFSWYQPFKAKITPSTTVIPTIYRPDGRVFREGVEEYGYLSGSLTYEDYTTPAIDKVQIRQSDSDVGVIYPAEEKGSNAWVIQSNLLLVTDSDANLRPVAQALYEAFRGIAYTPCSFSVPASVEIEAGSIVELEDVRGNTFTTYVMEATVSGTKRTLRSTGNAKRDGNAATNRQILKNLTGKMLEIQTSVDGLDIKASQLDGDFAELQLTVEGLSSRVEQDLTDLQVGLESSIDQTADSIKAEVKKTYATQDSLTGYTKTNEVRSRFAMDASSVTVESGVVKFKGNTFQVEAANFSVDSNGTVRLVTADAYSRATIANGVFEIANQRVGTWKRAATMASHDNGSTDVVCYDENGNLAIAIAYTDGLNSSGSSINFTDKFARLMFGNGAAITSGYMKYGEDIPGQQLVFYGSGERAYGLKLGVTDGTWALAPVTARYLGLGTPEHPFDTIYCKQVVQV